DWFVLAHGEQALMMVTRMSENLRRAVRLKLVYVDDADRHAPPEAVAGSVPLVGYRGLDVERLPADRYQFQLRIFNLTPSHAGEAGGDRAGHDGDHARRGERARGGRAARAAPEVHPGDEHVTPRDPRGESAVEVREEPARRLRRGERREAGRQDVGGGEIVGE